MIRTELARVRNQKKTPSNARSAVQGFTVHFTGMVAISAQGVAAER
jgi:predicted transcriptional regulator with HTH domain